MDPATAITAATSTFETLNRIGGVVAVLLGLLVLLVSVVIILGIKVFRHISKRLGDTEDSRVALLTGCIKDNTAMLGEVKAEMHTQTNTIRQQNDAMRDRPCLIETGVHHRTPLPQMRTN